ncbi:YpjP family protein [Lederbergia sp. NSJ-179]|uniref:YpjP family protein n=1 Tax=Lederbergia sp. NSJ-179 TaxID=2931402 RepID=UPI001FD328D7|nr:YpjP family protein [Lederbergia sp. NSJ-179]MCJ7841138.1 YpjP family protein [Lederbergia sp. NSJ-179]
MRMWIRKSLIILVSILTFGMVNPSHAFWSQNQESPKSLQRSSSSNATSQNRSSNEEMQLSVTMAERDQEDQIIDVLIGKAEQQAMIKFGPKISNVIESEFNEVIMPHIIGAIEMTAAQYPGEELKNLAITEKPGGGVSEKIFNIYHAETGKDLMLFHVRREKPPLEGYQFNFHYHTYHDQFQTHYTMGTIYWSKDTPPHWQTV